MCPPKDQRLQKGNSKVKTYADPLIPIVVDIQT